MQPDTNKEASTSNKTAIAVIGFNCIRLVFAAEAMLNQPFS
jgi:hypothetical protein